MSAINMGAAGALTAIDRFDASAGRMVAGGDPTSETMRQISAQQAFTASISVLRTGDQMMKHLLDIKV